MSNWKSFERDVAKMFGVERHSKTALGESVPDVLKKLDNNHTLVIECKNKKVVVVEKEMKDIEKHRINKGDIPILCYRKTNSKKTQVFMKLKDFKIFYKWVIRVRKSCVQSEEIVIRLDIEDFKWMFDYGERSD